MTNVAVVGNREWQNKRKVQQILVELKQKFNKDLIVVGAGGHEGANHLVKKYSLEFGIKYKEYNPSYTGYNLYSALPESYYGKKYHFSQLLHRMRLLAENCDYLIILNNEQELNPQLQTAYSKINKLNKPVVVLG
jgi:CTP:phosphocholine cytidylyltransferase-like protein